MSLYDQISYWLEVLGYGLLYAFPTFIYIQIGGYFFKIDFWALGSGLSTPIPWPWR